MLPRRRRSAQIARAELRVGWRKWREKSLLQQGVLAFGGLFWLLLTAVGGVLGAGVGEALVSGEVDTPLETAAILPAGLFVGVIGFSAYMTALQYDRSDIQAGLLTTVPHRDVVGGLIIATFLRVWVFLMLPFIAAAVSVGFGAHSPPTVILAITAFLCVLLPGYVLGFATGLGIKHLLGQSEVVDRYRSLLAIFAMAAYIGLIATESLDTVIGPLVAVAQDSPIAWTVHLALLPVVDSASVLRGGMVVGLSLGLTGIGIWSAVRSAESLWYADPVTSVTQTKSTTASRLLGQFIGYPSAWVATKSWLRARRAPLKLIYIVYPVFLIIDPIGSSISSGTVSVALPAFTAIYGAWATGAAFGLNPLGDEGAVLPITVTSGVTGLEVVRGLMAACLVPGLPVTVGLTGVLALASPMTIIGALGIAIGGGLLCVAAAGLAVGVGTAFPRYDAASLTRSREAVVPSMWAFVVYSLLVLVLATPATVVYLPGISDWIGDLLGLEMLGVFLSGLGLALLLVGIVSLLGIRYCARAIEGYTVS